jgi:acetyl-CoA acetyltransferase
MRKVAVIGVGVHPWGAFEDKSVVDLAVHATTEALKDANLKFRDIQAICAGASIYFPALGPGLLGNVLVDILGGTGIPCIPIQGGCVGSAVVFHLAYLQVASGLKDIVLAVGSDKNPRGQIASHAPADAEDKAYIRAKAVGVTNPGQWALNCRRRMIQHGTTEEQLAKVSVKAHKIGALNPYARYKKVLTLQDVLASPMIADPLRLYEICTLSHGAAATILCSAEKAKQFTNNPVFVAASTLSTQAFGEPQLDVINFSMTTTPTAKYFNCCQRAVWTAYEEAGMGPKDIDFTEIGDTSVWQELENIELFGFCKPGESEGMLERGDTGINGKLPVNPSGGFQSFGEATAAQGMLQVAEAVWQMRGQAGQRQINNPKSALLQLEGLGPNASATILKV